MRSSNDLQTEADLVKSTDLFGSDFPTIRSLTSTLFPNPVALSHDDAPIMEIRMMVFTCWITMAMLLLELDQIGEVLIERLVFSPPEAKVVEDFDPFGSEFDHPIVFFLRGGVFPSLRIYVG